jgi:hypothetical protein
VSEDGRRGAFPPPRGQGTGYREPQLRDERPIYPDEPPKRTPHLQPFPEDDPLSPDAVALYAARQATLEAAPTKRSRAVWPPEPALVGVLTVYLTVLVVIFVAKLLLQALDVSWVVVLLVLEVASVAAYQAWWRRRRSRLAQGQRPLTGA